MRLLRALRRHPYGGQYREVGAVYEAPEKFARLITRIGKAEYAQVEVEPVTPPKSAQPESPSKAVLQEAEELGIDLAKVPGTGKDGRILKRDLDGYKTRMMQAD